MNSRLRKIDCDALIFDLDGVLWDTTETCAAAWNRICARHAIEFREIAAADVRAVTGRPHESPSVFRARRVAGQIRGDCIRMRGSWTCRAPALLAL